MAWRIRCSASKLSQNLKVPDSERVDEECGVNSGVVLGLFISKMSVACGRSHVVSVRGLHSRICANQAYKTKHPHLTSYDYRTTYLLMGTEF